TLTCGGSLDPELGADPIGRLALFRPELRQLHSRALELFRPQREARVERDIAPTLRRKGQECGGPIRAHLFTRPSPSKVPRGTRRQDVPRPSIARAFSRRLQCHARMALCVIPSNFLSLHDLFSPLTESATPIGYDPLRDGTEHAEHPAN